MRSLLPSLLLTIATSAPLLAGTGTWASAVTGSKIAYTTLKPEHPLTDQNGKYMTIVYLENLNVPCIGQNSNEADVDALLAEGYHVIRLDYAGDERATSPTLNRDISAINDDLNDGNMCKLSNLSTNRSYVLFEGYRIKRDVGYYLDDPSVYNWPGSAYSQSRGDSLYMDIIYPANPREAVPVVLSFSYANSYATVSNGKVTDAHRHQRLFLGYTLSMFDDTVLEGAPARGMAWAIADHPKYCDWGQGKPQGGANKDYGAIETNPDAARKVKSAIRTLRTVGQQLGLSGEVGIYGFSRGSTAGSLAIGDRVVDDFRDATRGCCPEADDRVQAAILGPGVFDYTLLPSALNEYRHATAVWGSLSANRDRWLTQGGAYLCQTKATAPTLFFYNQDDEAYYATQVNTLHQHLAKLGVDTDLLRDYGVGHSVPTDTASLRRIYDFLSLHLHAAPQSLTVPTRADATVRTCYDLFGRRVIGRPSNVPIIDPNVSKRAIVTK